MQRWVWRQSWTEFRDIQEQAVVPILGGDQDVIIASATASGKTEAAFLPICSRLVREGSNVSVAALYVGPLKALINDQFSRLEELCDELNIAVHRWHGDVGQNRKRAVVNDPTGVLLITPESLEALFVNHGTRIEGVFEALQYVVVDELHAFIGSERGKQLQSLLHRLELVLHRSVPRIALSATLGDMGLAAEYLRPGQGDSVRIIAGSGEGNEVKLQIRGYRITPPKIDQEDVRDNAGQADIEMEDAVTGDYLDISRHLFNALRGSNNLIYANRRRDVELYADLLRRSCERLRVPSEFWPHHGNLARDLRQDVESFMKQGNSPVNVVCTSTLELGIDIGRVKSVAQIGTPPSVSSLRQRLGRSGRRGEAAVVRIYVQEPELDSASRPQDALRPQLLQAIASVELLLRAWYEPPVTSALHLSTLVQQILSLIAQYGGVSAAEAHRALSAAGGPFHAVDRDTFASVLRSLGDRDLLHQMSDGTLVLGLKGERLVNHYSFYAAFATPDEYRLTANGKNLGTLPIDYPVIEGMFMIFAGRRWRVESVDAERKMIALNPSSGGKPPTFGGTGAPVHDRVRLEMRRVCESAAVPAYLDARAQDLLHEARDKYAELNLSQYPVVRDGKDLVLFLWMGDRTLGTIAIQLSAMGFQISRDGIALTVSDTSKEELYEALHRTAAMVPPDPLSLAETVQNKRLEKYDSFLDEELLGMTFASSRLDIPRAWNALKALSASLA